MTGAPIDQGSGPDGKPIRRFETQAAFAAWLADHHGSGESMWLQFAKKGSGEQTLSYGAPLSSSIARARTTAAPTRGAA
ncbi:MAG: hypothetical protein ACR2NA_12195 [Solirubrobacterales bacterium]